MINLKQYGYTETEIPSGGLLPGRVTELRRERYAVITERGEVTAALKGSFYHHAEMREELPCVGDFVLLQYNGSGPSLIIQLLPRRSKFSRADFSGHGAGYVKTILEQVVATNFDFVLIVTPLNQDFKVSRIARYLTQARQSGGQPVVILTKADLIEDVDAPVSAVRKAAPDVPVHAVSSHTGFGLDALNEYLLPGKTLVFLGMSGVGKSSLLNVLMGQEVMAVKDIREDDGRGRHTTTHRQLFMLPSGAMVIDTPGMRELGLFGAEEGVGASFFNVEELFTHCRFSDCRHQTEPGCAVIAAIANGSLTREQLDGYLAQKQEVKFAEDKSAYMRGKQNFQKSIAKFSRLHHKHGGKK
jgi:ribosome biogenesis GTPase